VTDLEDQPLAMGSGRLDAGMVRAFESYQSTFWRFLEPDPSMNRSPNSMSVC
jgi:hypothetical protein